MMSFLKLAAFRVIVSMISCVETGLSAQTS